MALEYPTEKSNTERQKKIDAQIKAINEKRNNQIRAMARKKNDQIMTDRENKIDAQIKAINEKRNNQIKKLTARREKFLKESRAGGYLSKNFQTPTEIKVFKKRTQKLDAQTADEVGSKKMKPVSKKAKDDYKFDQLIESLTGKKGKSKVMKKNMGGSLKAVNNPGLAKLPTPVRNKMGYAKGGGKVKGYKKGGSITYRMSGGQVVGHGYD